MFLRRGKLTLLILALPIAAIMFGCAAKKSMSDIPESGLHLKYQMPDDMLLRYAFSNGYIQNMKVMEKSVKIEGSETSIISVRSKGLNGQDYQLKITIDSMSFILQSPSGNLTPDMNDVIGKEFAMSLTPGGKEFDITGADSIQYEVMPGEKQSAAAGFKAMFPDLPDKPVKIGDTWITSDTVSEKTGSGDLNIILNNVNRLDGFEKINGVDCARIAATTTGTITGTGKQQGMDLVTKGGIEDEDIWYFAYKVGVFIKMTSSGLAKSTITATGTQNMVIPTGSCLCDLPSTDRHFPIFFAADPDIDEIVLTSFPNFSHGHHRGYRLLSFQDGRHLGMPIVECNIAKSEAAVSSFVDSRLRYW